MSKKANKPTGSKSVATALLELLTTAIEEGVVQASDVTALVGEDAPKASRAKSKAKAKDEDEDEDEDADDDEEDGEELPDFEDMTEKELKKFCKDNEIEIPKKIKGESALRSFLEEQFASDDEDEDADDEDADDEDADDEEAPDFSEMNIKELKKFVKENDLDVPAKALKDEEKLRAWLEEQFASDDEDEDEDEDDEDDEELDFSEMDHKELKAFAKENDLDVPAKTLKDEEKLRAWLEENFASDEDEDDDEDADDEEDEEDEEWEDD